MKILFQGDSVTDAGRNYDEKSAFNTYGQGYANLVASTLQLERPGELEFVNRAVSGNRVVDLYARWRKDCVRLQPDLVSIMIGVNDVWHEFHPVGNGVPTPRFERILRMLISETQEEVPGVKFMLLEPFVTHGGAVDDKFDAFYADVRDHVDALRRVAEEFGVPVVPLQAAFDEAVKLAPPDYWTIDGVHPTSAGHALIAKNWIGCFRKYFDKKEN